MAATLAQMINRAKADLKNIIDQDELVMWADWVQEDIFNLDIPLFVKRNTSFATTDGTKTYDISDVGSDVRKIRSIFRVLSDTTDPSDYDYNASTEYQYKYYDFTQNDTQFFLNEDPDGYTLTVEYYRTPTAITSISSSIDLPARYRRGIYIGLMKYGEQRKLETPSVNWEAMWDKFIYELKRDMQSINQGAKTVKPYNIFVSNNI